jgi:hypothetical protein
MVPYPRSFVPVLQGNEPLGASEPVGVDHAIEMQNAAPGPVIVMGTSQGALAVDDVMRRDMAAGVSKDKVSFVVIDDPQRGSGILTFAKGVHIPVLNYTPKAAPETPYDVTVVTKQYDGMADMPNNPKSPGYALAMLNAGLGAQLYHPSSVYSNLSTVPQSNITTSVNNLGGKTTTYYVPTPTLPIVTAMEKAGLPKQLGNPLNKALKPLIDSAYSHPKSPKPAKPAKLAKPTTAVKASKPKAEKGK